MKHGRYAREFGWMLFLLGFVLLLIWQPWQSAPLAVKAPTSGEKKFDPPSSIGVPDSVQQNEPVRAPVGVELNEGQETVERTGIRPVIGDQLVSEAFGVVRDDGGRPLLGVSVRLREYPQGWLGLPPEASEKAGWNVVSGTTDVHGEYSIKHSYLRLSTEVEKEGFTRIVEGPSKWPLGVRREQSFVLEEGLSVVGVVIDDRRCPVEGALIQLFADGKIEPVRSTRTTSGGVFESDSLRPGKLILSATKDGMSRSTFECESGDVNLRVTLLPSGAVRAMLASRNGGSPCILALRRINVILKTNPYEVDHILKESIADGTGTLVFDGIDAGEYIGALLCPGYALIALGRIVVVARSTCDVGTCELTSGGTICGVVNKSDGRPASGALVVSRIEGFGDVAGRSREFQRLSKCANDGSYSIDSVPLGRNSVFAMGESRVRSDEMVAIVPGVSHRVAMAELVIGRATVIRVIVVDVNDHAVFGARVSYRIGGRETAVNADRRGVSEVHAEGVDRMTVWAKSPNERMKSGEVFVVPVKGETLEVVLRVK